MELATKKRDRENKENKEKILSNTRREIERKNEYQVSHFFSCVSHISYQWNLRGSGDAASMFSCLAQISSTFFWLFDLFS